VSVDAVGQAIAATSIAATRLPLSVPLPSGRVVLIDLPRDATDTELADFAVLLLGPIRGQCATNRGRNGHSRILVP
jgi:hypothetical protein